MIRLGKGKSFSFKILTAIALFNPLSKSASSNEITLFLMVLVFLHPLLQYLLLPFHLKFLLISSSLFSTLYIFHKVHKLYPYNNYLILFFPSSFALFAKSINSSEVSIFSSMRASIIFIFSLISSALSSFSGSSIASNVAS